MVFKESPTPDIFTWRLLTRTAPNAVRCKCRTDRSQQLVLMVSISVETNQKRIGVSEGERDGGQ
jgi:hypothetical protein